MARTLKSCLGVISLVALLLISGYGTAEAVKAHPDACNGCHRLPGANPRSINSLCLACHASAGPAAAQAAGVFTVAAASNAFHGSAGTDAGSQTSHYWGGSKTAYLPAGSQDPSTTFYSSRAQISTGLVTCSICHDPHNDMATTTKLLRKTTKTSDLNDAICKQCHAPYYIDNPSALLTHPVGPTAVPTVDPLKFNAPVVNIASGNIQFFNGSVSCSSCHSTHFADSNSTTVDGKGQTLAAGDGKLLRTDGPLVTDPDPQIQADRRSAVCTACHPYKTHGGAAESLSCFVCHSVHNPTAATNVFVLRNSVTTATYGTVTGISYTTVPPLNLAGSSSWADTGATTKGYCEKCHGDLLNILAGGISESRTHIEGENCRTCHVHHKADATRSFAAAGGCDGCHGYPPTQNIAGGNPNSGYAAGYTPFKDESVTPHAAHAAGSGNYSFSCSSCHLNNNHNSASSFQDVFLGADAPLATGNGNLSPTYTATGSGTCANVYCHSNGGARTSDAARTYTAASIPVWTAGSSTGAITTCNACHDNSGAMARNSAAHAAHIAKGYTCNVCHKDTAANNSTLATGAIGGKHVNGSRDIVFNTTYSLGAANLNTAAYPDSNAGTCAVYCHSNGTTLAASDWDLPASGDCGACHKYNLNADATQDGSGPSLDTTHQTHIFDATGPKLACTICHTHDGSNVHANAGDHVDGATSYVSNYQTAVCNPCHGASNGVTSGDDRQPIWTSTASVDCQTCHTGSAIAVISGRGGLNSFVDQKEYATGHGKVGVIQICANCHDTAAAGHFDGDGADRLKADPKLDGGGEVYTVSANAWCQDCHTATTNIHYGTATTCAVCHEPHGKGMAALGNTAAMLVKGKGFINKAARDSYINPTPLFDGVCQVCHIAGLVNNFNTTTDANLTHYPGQTCTDCHKHDTSTAFAPSGCTTCHGDAAGNFWPDGSTYPDRLGSHALHIDKIAIQNFGVSPTLAQKNSTCNWCHPGGGHSGDQLATPADLMDGSASKFKNILGAVNVQSSSVAQNAGDVSCSNVDCHYSKVTVSTDWYTAGSQANCNYCHTVVDAPYLAGSLPDAHDKHMQEAGDGGRNLICTNCHATAAVNSHQNGVIDFSTAVAPLETVLSIDTATTSGSKLGPKYNAGAASTEFSSCSNLICHGNFTGGNNAAPNWYKTDARIVGDNNDDGACGTCHGIDIAATPTSNAHNEHMSAGYTGATCTDCHTAATASTHVDKSINIDTGKATYTLAVAGAVAINGAQNGTCLTAGCHNPTVPAVQSAAWNTVGALACNACHGDATAGLTTSHGDHITAGKACSTCHTVPVDTTHISDKSSLSDGATVTAGEAAVTITGSTTYTYTSPTCTNNGATPNNGLGCHATGTPSWGTAFASTACTNCHTNTTTSAVNPTSGLHGVTPYVTGVQHDSSFGTGGTCSSCHNTMPVNGTHKDGAFTADTVANFGLRYYSQSVANSGSGTCATTTCHFSSAAGISDDWAHVWTNAASAPTYYTTSSACDGCHGDNLASADLGTTGVTHRVVGSKHNGVATNYTCRDCHAIEGAGYTFTFNGNDWGGISNHGNGSIDINNTGTSYNETTGYCGGCHGTAYNFPNTAWNIAYVAGNALSTNCGECHQGGVTTGAASTAHTEHGITTADLVAGGPECIVCHGNNSGNNFQNTLAGSHGDNAVTLDTTRITAYAGGLVKWDASQSTCTNNCHLTASNPVWDVVNTLACNSCHYYEGTVNSANNTGSTAVGGSHNAHFVATSVTACTQCHPDRSTDTASPHAHISGTTLLERSSEGLVANNAEMTPLGAAFNDTNKTCNNTACHNPSGTSYVSNAWGTANATCTMCHSATNPGTDSHDEHMGAATTFGINTIACTSCHVNNGTNYAHTNGTVTFVVGMNYSGGAQAPLGTNGTCNTSTCHNDGTVAVTAVPTTNWGTPSVDCTLCHGNAPATGAHASHANATYVAGTCSDCHTAANVITHINGTRNTTNKVSVYNVSPNFTCTNSCHIANTTNDWTPSAALACTDCHGSGIVTIPALDRSWPPLTGSHDMHVGNVYVTGANCTDCHSNNTVTHSTLNNVIAAIGGTKVSVYTANNCTNSCHLAAYTNVWASGALTCADCHNGGGTLDQGTWPPSSFAHTGHMASNALPGATAQNDCYACHGNTINSSGVLTGPDHLNLIAGDVTLSTTFNYQGVAVTPGGTAGTGRTCSNVLCHNGVATPTWGSGAITCGKCHNTSGTGPLPSGSIAADHSMHANNDAIYTDCDNCHVGAISYTAKSSAGGQANHQNLAVNVAFTVATLPGATYTDGDGRAGVNYSGDFTDDGTCASVECHFNVTTPAWNAAASAYPGRCVVCHNDGAGTTLKDSVPSATATIHDKHVTTASANYITTDCAACHGTGADTATHSGHGKLDGVDFVAGFTYNSGNQNCTNACHIAPNVADWSNAATLSCTDCHTQSTKTLGAVGSATMSGTVAPETGMHTIHMGNTAYAGQCTDCHSHSGALGTAGHVNGPTKNDINVANSITVSPIPADNTCTNNCHNVSAVDDNWVTGALECTDCHNAPGKSLTQGAWPPASNKHTKHVGPAAFASYGEVANHSTAGAYEFGCGYCHSNNSNDHANGSVNITVANWTAAGKTCGTNSCHNDGTAALGAPAITADWDAAAPAQSCNMCHGNSPTTAAHQVHTVGIHALDIYTGTTGKLTTATTPKAHGDATVSTTINCNICHSQTVTMARNKLGTECVSCHTGDANDVINIMSVADKSKHIDTQRQVVFASSLTAGGFRSKAQLRDSITTVTELNDFWTRTNGYKAATSYDASKPAAAAFAGNTCSAIACHSGIPATWQAPANDCTTCHTSLPK